jgi:predicted nucleic acid-binding Zn ribbon protein
MDVDLEKLEEAPQQNGRGRARRAGIYKLLISVGVLLPVWLYLQDSGSTIGDLNSVIFWAAVSAAGFGLASVPEIVSGMPLSTLVAVLEVKWASLRRWQRAILAIPMGIFALVVFTLVLIWIPW